MAVLAVIASLCVAGAASAATRVTAATHDPGYQTKRYLVGDDAGVEATVRNKGRRKADASRAKVFLSANQSAGAGDQAVGAIKFPALKPDRKATSFTRIAWPAAVDDGNYYFVVCAKRKRRCEATKRFEVYDLSDRLLGTASGTSVVRFSGANGFGDPMEKTVTSKWSLTFTLKSDADVPYGITPYGIINSSGKEATSGTRTTQYGDGAERCEWSSAEATFTDTAEGGFDIGRESLAPTYLLDFAEYEGLIPHTENCTYAGGPPYTEDGAERSVINCCAPVGDEPFVGFPLSGSYDDVREDVSYYGDLITTTDHVEWHLREADQP